MQGRRNRLRGSSTSIPTLPLCVNRRLAERPGQLAGLAIQGVQRAASFAGAFGSSDKQLLARGIIAGTRIREMDCRVWRLGQAVPKEKKRVGEESDAWGPHWYCSTTRTGRAEALRRLKSAPRCIVVCYSFLQFVAVLMIGVMAGSKLLDSVSHLSSKSMDCSVVAYLSLASLSVTITWST